MYRRNGVLAEHHGALAKHHGALYMYPFVVVSTTRCAISAGDRGMPTKVIHPPGSLSRGVYSGQRPGAGHSFCINRRRAYASMCPRNGSSVCAGTSLVHLKVTVFASVQLLQRLCGGGGSDAQIRAAGRWGSYAFRKYIRLA